MHPILDGSKDCPANGFALGIAWSVFKGDHVHGQVQATLGCEPSVWRDANSWFHWLVEKDKNTHTYNLHRLTLWFLDKADQVATTNV